MLLRILPILLFALSAHAKSPIKECLTSIDSYLGRSPILVYPKSEADKAVYAIITVGGTERVFRCPFEFGYGDGQYSLPDLWSKRPVYIKRPVEGGGYFIPEQANGAFGSADKISAADAKNWQPNLLTNKEPLQISCSSVASGTPAVMQQISERFETAARESFLERERVRRYKAEAAQELTVQKGNLNYFANVVLESTPTANIKAQQAENRVTLSQTLLWLQKHPDVEGSKELQKKIIGELQKGRGEGAPPAPKNGFEYALQGSVAAANGLFSAIYDFMNSDAVKLEERKKENEKYVYENMRRQLKEILASYDKERADLLARAGQPVPEVSMTDYSKKVLQTCSKITELQARVAAINANYEAEAKKADATAGSEDKATY